MFWYLSFINSYHYKKRGVWAAFFWAAFQKTAAIGTDLRPHLRNAAIVVAYCHVLNAAKICLQAVNKGPMAALFEMWPKKGLFYVIIRH